MQSRILSKLTFLVSTALFLSITSCSTSQIDSLKTDNDVFSFVRQFFKVRTSKGIFDKYYNETIKVADSLKTKNWIKADIDNNGELDLLMFRADGLPNIFAILSISGKYTKVTANYWCKYQFIYPIVRNINGKNLLLLYSQNQKDYNQESKTFTYTKLQCDTLTIINNRFVNYVKSPRQYHIEKIEISNNGMCEGNCPRINISINPKKLISTCIKQEDGANAVKNYMAQLTQTEIKSILLLLGYSNFSELKNKYDVGCSDQPTTTLTITFNNGKTKKIEDYGSSGNFTLAELYNIAYNIKWKQVK